MKILVDIARYFVGGLFIFSGLIKINDPVGTAIKLEEYFQVFAADFAPFFTAFIPLALPLSVFLCVLEVVLGLAVILNYRMEITSWIMLVIIVFFTFLTFYSAVFNKVTDCGCFGDAIKLTPWQSFYKDIVLTILIVLIFVYRKQLKPLFSGRIGDISIGVFTLINLVLAITAIRHLPFIDFRDYKVGNNIGQLMEPAEKLQYGPQVYTYENLQTGENEEYEKWVQQLSDTTQFKFVSYDRPLLNPEALPKITDFAVESIDGEDLTANTFQGSKLILVMYDATHASKTHLEQLNNLSKSVSSTAEPIILTASSQAVMEQFKQVHNLNMPYYFTDATVLKAMIRSNPGLLLMNNGTVKGKWHHNDVPAPTAIERLIP